MTTSTATMTSKKSKRAEEEEEEEEEEEGRKHFEPQNNHTQKLLSRDTRIYSFTPPHTHTHANTRDARTSDYCFPSPSSSLPSSHLLMYTPSSQYPIFL